MIARSTLGLAGTSSGKNVRYEVRCVAGQLSLPGGREIVLASVYLQDSEGIGATNASVLAEIAALVAEARAEQFEVLIGGDWNNSPDVIAQAVGEFGLDVVHGDLALGTSDWVRQPDICLFRVYCSYGCDGRARGDHD